MNGRDLCDNCTKELCTNTATATNTIHKDILETVAAYECSAQECIVSPNTETCILASGRPNDGEVFILLLFKCGLKLAFYGGIVRLFEWFKRNHCSYSGYTFLAQGLIKLR